MNFCRTHRLACLGSLAWLMVALSWSHAFAEDDDVIAHGKVIYENYCAGCHGFDGIPLLPETPNFYKAERMEIDDAILLASIRNGKGAVMPPWEAVLTEEQCRQALAYIRKMPELLDE